MGSTDSRILLKDIDSGLGFNTQTLEEFRQSNPVTGENYTEYLQCIGEILKKSNVKKHYSDAGEER